MIGSIEDLFMRLGRKWCKRYRAALLRSAEFDLHHLRQDLEVLPFHIEHTAAYIDSLRAKIGVAPQACRDPSILAGHWCFGCTPENCTGCSKPQQDLEKDPEPESFGNNPLEVRVHWNDTHTIITSVVLCDSAGDVVQTLAVAQAAPPTPPAPAPSTDVFVRMADAQDTSK